MMRLWSRILGFRAVPPHSRPASTSPAHRTKQSPAGGKFRAGLLVAALTRLSAKRALAYKHLLGAASALTYVQTGRQTLGAYAYALKVVIYSLAGGGVFGGYALDACCLGVT